MRNGASTAAAGHSERDVHRDDASSHLIAKITDSVPGQGAGSARDSL